MLMNRNSRLPTKINNDKLITCNEVFAVHEPTSFRALYRWSYGENREVNLTRLQTVVRDAKNFVTAVYSSRVNAEHDFASCLHTTTMQQTCRRMLVALRSSIKGIENLHQTYRDDHSIRAKLQILIDEIRDFVEATIKASSPILESAPPPSRPTSPLLLVASDPFVG